MNLQSFWQKWNCNLLIFCNSMLQVVDTINHRPVRHHCANCRCSEVFHHLGGVAGMYFMWKRVGKNFSSSGKICRLALQLIGNALGSCLINWRLFTMHLFFPIVFGAVTSIYIWGHFRVHGYVYISVSHIFGNFFPLDD